MNKILIFILVFALSSCATQLKYEMNNVKLLTPEAKGKFLKGDLGLSSQQTHKVILNEAFDYVIFNVNDTTEVNTVENGSDVSFNLNLGLLEKIDLFLLGGKTGIKYQFIGGHQLSKSTDFKGAIAIAYGKDSPDSESIVYASNNTTRTYSTSVDLESFEFSFLFGRRTTANHLYYTNLFYDKYHYDGKLTSNQFATVTAKGKSTNMGLLLGYEASNSTIPSLSWKLETGVVQGRLESFAKKNSGVFGTSLSIGW